MNAENKVEKSKLLFLSNSDLFKSRDKIINMNLDIDGLSLFYEDFDQKDSPPILEVIIIDDELKNFERKKMKIDKVLKFEILNKIKYTHQYPDTDQSYN
jgi:hypothetical protein